MKKIKLNDMILILRQYKDTKIEDNEYINNYIKELNKYSKYVIPEKQELWNNNISKLVYDLFKICKYYNKIDYEKYDELYSFIDASEIIESFSINKDWNKIDIIIENQDHSFFTLCELSKRMLEYSVFGIEFINRYFPFIIKRDKECKILYDNVTEYKIKRTELETKLVKTLIKKI